MSDEFRFKTTSTVALEPLASALRAVGLAVLGASSSEVRFALAGTAADNLERWGGHVIVERDADGLFVTCNGLPNRREVLEAIETELKAQNICSRCEEV